MSGRSGASVERMGTTMVETSGGGVSMGAWTTGAGGWDGQAASSSALVMTERRMRPIRFLQRLHLFIRQLDLRRRYRLLQLLHLRRPDDRRRHPRLVQDPGEGDLRRRHAAALRDLDDAVDDVEVALRVIHTVRVVVALRALGRAALPVAAAVAGEKAARERAPGDHADALFDAERDHLALFLAIDEVVGVLHRNEARPAAALGGALHLREAPRPHARRADVARLPALHHVVQRLHRFLDGRCFVKAMDLIQVDVVRAEATKRGVDRLEDVLAREPLVVRAGAGAEEDLRGDDDLVAFGEVSDGPAEDLLAGAVRVHVCGVEEGDPRFERAADEGAAGLFVENPRGPLAPAVGHASEARGGDFEAAAAERGRFHAAHDKTFGNSTPLRYPSIGSMSEAVTRGIRVEGESEDLSERSEPREHYFFFAYHVRISNLGSENVQLLSRE